MTNGILTFSCLKSKDGVLLAKEIADSIQKMVTVASVEMITIVSNTSYDCFYIFANSYDWLCLDSILEYSRIKNILIRMGFTDTANCGSSEEGSFINVSGILRDLDLRYLELDATLDKGEVYEIASRESFDTSLAFKLRSRVTVMQHLRYIQSQMLTNKSRVSDIIKKLREEDKVIFEDTSVVKSISTIEYLQGVLHLDCIGVSQSVSLINRLKLF